MIQCFSRYLRILVHSFLEASKAEINSNRRKPSYSRTQKRYQPDSLLFYIMFLSLLAQSFCFYSTCTHSVTLLLAQLVKRWISDRKVAASRLYSRAGFGVVMPVVKALYAYIPSLRRSSVVVVVDWCPSLTKD